MNLWFYFIFLRADLDNFQLKYHFSDLKTHLQRKELCVKKSCNGFWCLREVSWTLSFQESSGTLLYHIWQILHLEGGTLKSPVDGPGLHKRDSITITLCFKPVIVWEGCLKKTKSFPNFEAKPTWKKMYRYLKFLSG